MYDQVQDEPGWAEAARIDEIARLGLNQAPENHAYRDIVSLVKTICAVPVALVSIVDADRQWFKAKAGTDLGQTPLDTSVCALAIRSEGVFVINDLALDPRTQHMSLVADTPHIRFYAGAPLVTSSGLPIGSLCAIDVVPRPHGLTNEQRIALEALARQTVFQIEADAHRQFEVSRAQAVGTWDWDVTADRVTADAAFAALYGVDAALAAGGAPIDEFFARVHPADMPVLRERIDEALASGEPFSCDYRLIQPDQTTRWVTAQGRCMLAEDGSPLRFAGVSFDIDERKRGEVRLAALVELGDRLREPGTPADLAFGAAEILGRTLEVDRAGYGTIDPIAETITIDRDWTAPGIRSLAGTLHFRDYGSYIEDLNRGDTVAVPDAYHDPRTRQTADALKAISAQAFINMPVTERGGFVALLYLNHGRARTWLPEELTLVREVAERTRDAVERRRVEAELARLTQTLEAQVQERTRELLAAEESLRHAQKMEAVGQLTGGLAHDFNNMLTGITGAIEMMQVRIAQGKLGELERYTAAAQGAAKRAAALTHRLLAFSRRQTLDPRPTDVNRLVAGLEELVRRTVGPAMEVEVVGTAGLWTAIVDPNQLESALLNLCINARDAMPNGGRITIETANKWLDERAARERDLQPGQYLSLCVTDTGTGMTEEVKARAFDPFYTTKPMGEGTGLGLSMIYGFARQSGGQVRIYSELGQGTTMCIYLPRYYGDAETGDEQLGRRSFTPTDTGQTVLVVDDEPTIRMLIVELLEDLGYHALEASDGGSALRLLESNARVDLLITDVGLPGPINGRQVADAARVSRPELAVLFVTGYAENAVVGNGHLEPGMRVVTKPFAMDVLAEVIADMLGAQGMS